MCSPGQSNAGGCTSAVKLYVGEGPRGSNGARFTLLRIAIFHSATHNQIGPLWCWFPSGWACAHSRTLWVSPTTSPVRLGVSPAAAPTPTGVFNQRFEALFPCAGALGCVIGFAPRPLSGLSVHECGAAGCYLPLCLPHSLPLWVWPSWFICVNVGLQGLPVVDCLPRSSHTPAVSVPPRQHESSLPWLPVSAPPTGLDEFLFFISLVSDFLAVWFSVSSGCVRRRSVSTYATILVPESDYIFWSVHIFM